MNAATKSSAAGLTTTPPVLMFVPHYPYPVVGGLERQAHELAKALRQQGVEVTVLAARFDAQHSLMENVEGVPVQRAYRSPPERLQLPWSAVRLACVLWQLRKRHRILHVHQNSWVGLFCTWWGRQLGYKVVAKLPNVGDHGVPGIARGRLGAVKMRMLKSAHCIVAMSAESCQELEAIGYPAERTLRVPNGIVASRVSTAKHGHEGDTKPHLRVVYVGRLGEEKSVHHLLKAWALAMQTHSLVATLEIWGDGPLQSDLYALAVQLNIDQRVAFRGRVADVRHKLLDMDIFVLASRVEGNSNAILEAMDAGLPIVATRVGGTPMQLGVAGEPWLVEPGDIQGLADRLVRLLMDRKLRLALGDAMRHRINKHFSMDSVARVYQHMYKRLDNEGAISLSDISGLPT